MVEKIKLEGVEDSIPTGAKFGKIVASRGEHVGFVAEEHPIVKDFVELISYGNGKILDLHHDRAKGNDAEDAALVGEILNNDFVEVAE